jgi:hypothetical protein
MVMTMKISRLCSDGRDTPVITSVGMTPLILGQRQKHEKIRNPRKLGIEFELLKIEMKLKEI